MLAVAQDVQGLERVRPVVAESGATFPVLLDRASELGRRLGFRIVPAGFFADAEGGLRFPVLVTLRPDLSPAACRTALTVAVPAPRQT